MKHYNVKTRMMLWVAVVITTIVTLSTIWTVSRAYERDLESLENRGRLLTKAQADAVAVPLWEMNHDRIAAILSGLKEDPDFISARVFDPKGLELSGIGSKEIAAHDFIFKEKIYNKSDDGQNKELLGTLEVRLTRAHLIEEEKEELLLSSLGFMFLLLTTMITIYVALTRVITRPLDTMLGIIKRMAGGDLRHRIPEMPQRELNVLASAFNKITSEVQLIYETIEERNRTLEIAIQALEVAREESDSANKTKSQFLASMTHELRTPLNAIIGYGEILIDDADEMTVEEIKSDLVKITSSGRHLLDLINDVLDITKIESGKVSLFMETFPVSGFLEQLLAITRPMVEKKNNKFEVVCDPDLVELTSDMTKLRQILVNLLSNSSKFTEDGVITLSIKNVVRDGQDFVQFNVKDTGIGMTQEQMDKIFEAFVQADSSTTRKFGGFGLGMTITKEFCRLMGGDVTVSSIPSCGTTFSVVLPARYKASSTMLASA